MTTILGLDISSFQIDACLLADGKPPEFKVGILGLERKHKLEERIGNVGRVVYEFCEWRHPTSDIITRPDWLVVEEPFSTTIAGKKIVPKALLMVVGAIIASTPTSVTPWLITPSDWREAIGSRNTKLVGHSAVERTMNVDYGIYWENTQHTHDEIDALGVALGARAILAGQVAV